MRRASLIVSSGSRGFGAVMSFLAAGLARIAAPAQVVDPRNHQHHSSSASKTCLATLLSVVATLWVSAALAQATPPLSGDSAADVIEYLARWRGNPPGSSTAALTGLYYMRPGNRCDSPPSGTDIVDGHPDVTTGVMTPTYGRESDALACTVGVGQRDGGPWDHTVKIKFKNTPEAIALCQDVNGLRWQISTESRQGQNSYRECDTERLMNFKLPTNLGAPEWDLVLTTQSGTQIVLGQWDGGGEWNLESPPACDTVDWQEVELSEATKDVFQCTVDGTPYAYADFHILTTDGTDVCANLVDQLPTEDNDGKGLFCSSDDGTKTVRAIYDWDNAYDGEKPPIALSWLISVEQIGSRGGSNCGKAGPTVAVRCANQLKSGQRAFRGMGGKGGEGIRKLDVTNLTNLSWMFFLSASFNDDLR